MSSSLCNDKHVKVNKGKVTFIHIERVEVWLHSIWTTLSRGAECPNLCSICLISGRRSRYTFSRWAGWVWEPIWSFRKTKKSNFCLFFFLSVLLAIVFLYNLCPVITYSSTTHKTNIHASGGTRNRNPSRRTVTDLRRRTRGEIFESCIMQPCA